MGFQINIQNNSEGSVGKGIFDMDLKVVDLQGNDLPKGEVGLLYGRSPQVFNGYWNKMEGIEESFPDAQWATVGDMARMDEDGFISMDISGLTIIWLGFLHYQDTVLIFYTVLFCVFPFFWQRGPHFGWTHYIFLGCTVFQIHGLHPLGLN